MVSNDYLLATNAKPQQFSHTFADPNIYTVNITAYNLHSEPTLGYVQYTHNITRLGFTLDHYADISIDCFVTSCFPSPRMIQVLIPVENWFIFVIDEWLDTAGGMSIYFARPLLSSCF